MAKRFRLAIITGGSSGIGLALARELVVCGTSVVLIARREELLLKAQKELKEQAGENTLVHILPLDITDSGRVSRELGKLMEQTGPPDFLFNGAGMAYPNHFEQIPQEVFQQTIQTNIGGTWNVLQSVVPIMKKEHCGTIVNVASVSGFLGTYGYTAYAASKFALTGLSESLRNEVADQGLDVRVLCPPDTDTPQLAREEETKPPETRQVNGNAGVMTSRAVAQALLKGLSRKSFMIFPNFMSRFTWWLHRMAPSLVYALIDKEVRKARSPSGKGAGRAAGDRI